MADHHKIENQTYIQSLVFIIGTEFCEKFNRYAFRGILSIYITEVLMYGEREAKIIYHLFAAAIYILPLFGEIVADSWLGKYKTIFYLSLVSAAGNAVLAVSAITPLQLPETTLLMVALAIIAVGTGGIKPCIVAFAEDQFVLPKEKEKMEDYLHVFRFIINMGGFISLLITPLLRSRVSCMGEDTCYSLAFLVPAVLMLLANAIFKAGKSLYRMVHLEKSMLLEVVACAYTAVQNKSRKLRKDHWLDYAVEKHGEEMVNGTKTILGILLVFSPVPIFWTLFEQQATAWIFQARCLNNRIGKYLTIFPDQMQVVNPMLVLVFIPLFKNIIYPGFSQIRLLRIPLQRMAIGGILVAIAFVLTASLQHDIENLENHGLEQLPAHKAIIRVINVFNCNVMVVSEYFFDHGNWRRIAAMSMYTSEVRVFTRETVECQPTECNFVRSWQKIENNLPERGRHLTCFGFRKNQPFWCILEDLTESLKYKCGVRVIFNANEDVTTINKPIIVKFFDADGNLYRQLFSSDNSTHYMAPGEYHVETYFGMPRYTVSFFMGAVYILGIFAETNSYLVVHRLELFSHYPIHMVALLPQYVIMTAGEVMLTVSGLEFAYEKAPEKMRSVILPLWLLTAGIGQIIVVLIEAIRFYEKDSSMYLLYANLMFVSMIVFILITIKQ